MKLLSKLLVAAMTAIVLSVSLAPVENAHAQEVKVVRPRTGNTDNSGGSVPAAPTNALLSQGGGAFTSTSTNTITFDDMAGATSYKIYRGANGATPTLYDTQTEAAICSAGSCTYADASATNNNTGKLYTVESFYKYYVLASNGSGDSAASYPAAYIYHDGTNTSCSQFSFGGRTDQVGDVVNGSIFVNVTTVSFGIYPYQVINDASGNGTGGAGVIPGGWSAGNPADYWLPYGTGSESVTVNSLSPSNGAATSAVLSANWDGPTGVYTLTLSNAAVASSVTLTNGSTAASWSGAVSGATGAATVNPAGSGSTGTYAMFMAATGTSAGDHIRQGGFSTNSGSNVVENCWNTTHPRPGKTYDMSVAFANGGVQQYTTANLSNGFDFNSGGFDYFRVTAWSTDNTHTVKLLSYSRPGGSNADTADLQSNYQATVYSNGSSSYGTFALNQYVTYLIPKSAFGTGTGTFVGCSSVDFQGTGQVQAGNVFFLVSTTTGALSSGMVLVARDGEWITLSTQVDGTHWNYTGSTQMVQNSTLPWASSKLIVTSVSSGTGPDYGGFISGGGYSSTSVITSHGVAGSAPAANSSIGAMYVTDSLGTTLPAVGTPSGATTCSSTATMNFQRTSMYKPQFSGNGTFQYLFVVDYGWSNN